MVLCEAVRLFRQPGDVVPDMDLGESPRVAIQNMNACTILRVASDTGVSLELVETNCRYHKVLLRSSWNYAPYAADITSMPPRLPM